MDKRHADSFKTLLRQTLTGYAGDKVEPSRDVLGFWWKALEPYPFAAIDAAFTRHNRKSKFKPSPAEIIEIINLSDGRPAADEAWPMAVKAADEYQTAVWTEETQQAWFHAWLVYEAGDEVGARMAFRQRYQSLVEQARGCGLPVKWLVSPGADPQLREIAVKQAEDAGRVSHDHAVNLLPAPEITGDGQHIAALVGYDAKPDDPPSTDVQENIKKLREELAKPVPDRKAEQRAKRKQAEDKRRAELEEQEKILAQARASYQEAE